MGLRVAPAAAAALSHVPPPSKGALREALRRLRDEGPKPAGLDVKTLDTLSHQERHFRLRVGDWRVAFTSTDKEIHVVHVFHRRDGYGWMERL